MVRFAYPLLAATVVIGTSTPALAQDSGVTFTGPRVEANIGWTQLGFDLAQLGGTGRDNRSDVSYGGTIGYDMALTPSLIGGVDVTLLGTNNSYSDGTADWRQRREIDATARLGTRIGSNALLYGKLGYTNLQVRQSTIAAGVTTDAQRDLDGLLAGIGGEYALTPKAFVKAEYRYTNYASGYEGNAILTGVGVRF